MKRVVVICFLLLFSALVLIAQEELVLQRVHVAPVEAPASTEVPRLYEGAGTTLFALINRDQPIIFSGKEAAHSSLRTFIEPTGTGVTIRFILSSKGETLHTAEGTIPVDEGNEDYAAFLNRSAVEFAPFLGKVAPVIRIRELSTDETTRQILDTLIFNQSLLSPFEATLWMGLVTKQAGGGDDGQDDPLYLHFPFHYFAEVAWYPATNHGISGTLFLEYSDFSSHAGSAGDPNSSGKSQNLYLLPGVGYTYRTSGRLSAGFFAGANFGGLLIEAKEDLVYENGLDLQKGESEWVFFHFVVMKPFVSYALNESWSIKTSFAIYITLLDLFPGPFQTDYYDLGDPWAEIQILNLGVSYRW